MEGNLSKRVILIDGMTCTSCEMRIENSLRKLEGIAEVKAVYSDSHVYVTYDKDKIGLDEIYENIEKLDYGIKNKGQSQSSEGKDENEYENSSENNKALGDKLKINQLIGIGIIIFSLYIIIKNTIGFNFIPEVNESTGYGILFVVGLLTSLHCIAMCGGINLSQCVSYNMEGEESGFSKLKPSLLYNGGRVISYTIVGGIVGAIGSAVSFSGSAKGVVAIAAGVFMVIMGINMLNIFPWLRRFNIRMPKFIGKKIYSNGGKKGPLIIGLLNGFMPCGPLQTMQLYALGTGSFTKGALSMFLFSLGTVPLMFGFGAISSLLSSKFTHKMMKVSAMLVMILGFMMVGRGLSLSGVSLALGASGPSSIAVVQGDVQLVTTEMKSGSYTPIIVQKGIPVRWTIKAEKSGLNGCNNPVTIPEYGIEKKLVPGDNVIEFTPDKEGNILYTCWMGMISSNIKVVADINNVSDKDIQDVNSVNGAGSAGGGCCGAGGSGVSSDGSLIPLDKVAVGEIKDNVQYVKIDVNDYGFSPAIVVIQKGIETKWNINGDKLNYCNNRLIFPEYNARMQLNSGENEISFVPEADFSFSCWMGMLNGYVKVVDDINNINIDDIKEEVRNFVPPQGAGGGIGGCH
ncbi:MAG: sulfite exporter TauE/SafE family protein [Bacillota bacterium]